MNHEIAESTDYAARARALMTGAARKGALVIMPLAVAAGAKAAVILPTSTESCTMHAEVGGPGTCSAGDTQTPEFFGLEGLNLSTTGNSGGYGEVSVSGGSSSTASLTLNVDGMLTADNVGDCVPGSACGLNPFQFSYDILVTSVANSGGSSGGFTIVKYNDYYDLTVSLNGTTIYTVTHGATTSDFSNTYISGSTLINVPVAFQSEVNDLLAGGGGSHNFDLSVTASIGWSKTSGLTSSQSQIQMHANSIELTSTTPEPGSMGLSLLGLAGFAAAIRRRWFRRA